MYVYLLKQPSTGLYKIGKTKNIENRIKQFKTGNPDNLFIIKYFESKQFYSKIEAALHNLYKIQRVENEWFDLTENEVNDFLDKCRIIEDNFIYLKNNSSIYVQV